MKHIRQRGLCAKGSNIKGGSHRLVVTSATAPQHYLHYVDECDGAVALFTLSTTQAPS